MSTEYLKFSPEILTRLGEELIPHPDQGIIELVRNSYDADATRCQIELKNAAHLGGSIIIEDDGIGMDLSAIRRGWLLIGRSSKSSNRRTALGRLQVGDKGLGRLAALRMGTKAVLCTRPKEENGVEYTLTIDWKEYDEAEFVESVPIEIKKSKTSKPAGTIITITDLRIRMGRREVDRIARQLVLLANPFDNNTGFRPRLIAPAFKDLEKKVHEQYFDEANYHLKAKLNDKGIAEAWVFDWKNNELWHARHGDISKDKYKTVGALLDLWVFLLTSKSFSTRSVTISEVRDWLSIAGGVHLYHRGLRVRPYGDPGHDWLEMNLARAKSPEERPSTNTTIGRIVVDDLNDCMIQKTDRIGFIENETFSELRRFAMDTLDWMARKRLEDAEKRRQKNRLQSRTVTTAAKTDLSKLIRKVVPAKQQPKVIGAMQKYERAVSRQAESLEENLQLYRSLATAGTTSAVFAHESAKPVTQIEKIADLMEKRIKRVCGESYDDSFEKPLTLLRRTATSLRSYALFPIYLLKKEKRSIGLIDVHKMLANIIELFEPFLTGEKIQVVIEYAETTPFVNGTEALLDAIITNLITNAVNAFNSKGAQTEDRKLYFRTILMQETLLIKVMDNGPGIKNISVDEIWLPGRSTTVGGTGFGLTIVKDAATDLSGQAYAIANGDLGGAEFTIELPLAKTLI